MKQIVSYKARIHAEDHKAMDDTVCVYRAVVSYLIDVVMKEWDALSPLSALHRSSYVEKLVHATSKRPVVKYPSFDRQFYKLPSYLRRSAIALAVGKVDAYK